MAMYPFDSAMPDDNLLQDMEEHLYNPLPDGLMEQDWLNLPAMERDWLNLPEIERDWLNLPEIEQAWLDIPDTHEQESLEHVHNDTHDFDLEM